MPTKRYYSLVSQLNGRDNLIRAYNHYSNYQLLYLIAKSKGISLAPSRCALVKYNAIPLPTVRQLTNKALNKFLKSDQLIIDSALFVNVSFLGCHNLDAPNKAEDGEVSFNAGLNRANKTSF